MSGVTHVHRVSSVSCCQLLDPRIITVAALHIDITENVSEKFAHVLKPRFVWPVGTTVVSHYYPVPASLMGNEEFPSKQNLLGRISHGYVHDLCCSFAEAEPSIRHNHKGVHLRFALTKAEANGREELARSSHCRLVSARPEHGSALGVNITAYLSSQGRLCPYSFCLLITPLKVKFLRNVFCA